MYRKNTAGQFICVQLILTATGAVATGASPAARRCIDGTFAAGGGTFTEDGSTGSYKYALAQADTNGNDISIIVTGTGAIPVAVNFVTTAADPTDAVHFGLTSLPNTAVTTNASLLTSGTGTDQLSVTSGRIDIGKALGSAVTTASAGILDVNTKNKNNAAALTDPTNFNLLSISAAGAIVVTSNVKKNQALAGFTFVMTDSTTHAPKTGVTVTAQRSLNGAALAGCANSVTEISSGLYTIDLAAADLNANVVMLRFTGTSSDDRDILIITQP